MKAATTRAIKKSPVAKAIHGGKSVKGSNVMPANFGGPAHGAALAARVWAEALNNITTWARYGRDIIETDVDARKTFRHDLNMQKKAASAADKASATKMTRTVFVRISELFTVSKAADKGMKIADVVNGWNGKGLADQRTAETISFPWIVEYSRAFLKEQGIVDGRGSSTPRMTSTEKVQKYLLVNITPADFPHVLSMVQKLAKSVKTPEQAKEMLDSLKPKKISDAGATPASVAASVKATKRVEKADKQAVG